MPLARPAGTVNVLGAPPAVAVAPVSARSPRRPPLDTEWVERALEVAGQHQFDSVSSSGPRGTATAAEEAWEVICRRPPARDTKTGTKGELECDRLEEEVWSIMGALLRDLHHAGRPSEPALSARSSAPPSARRPPSLVSQGPLAAGEVLPAPHCRSTSSLALAADRVARVAAAPPRSMRDAAKSALPSARPSKGRCASLPDLALNSISSRRSSEGAASSRGSRLVLRVADVVGNANPARGLRRQMGEAEPKDVEPEEVAVSRPVEVLHPVPMRSDKHQPAADSHPTSVRGAAVGGRRRGAGEADSLEALVGSLRQELERTEERKQALEELLMAAQGCTPAVTKSAQSSISACNFLASKGAASVTGAGPPPVSSGSGRTPPPESSLDGEGLPSPESAGGPLHAAENSRLNRGGTMSQDTSIAEAAVAAEPLEHLWEFVIQGELASDLRPELAHKNVTCFPAEAMDRLDATGISFLCARGHRVDPGVPNQDDILLAMCSCLHGGRAALFGVFDGHGPAGHLCAAFARRFLPERVFADPELLVKPRAALRHAFREAQSELLQQPFDVQFSGAAATVALLLDGCPPSRGQKGETRVRLLVAHVGDGRALLVSRWSDEEKGGQAWGRDPGAYSVTALTREHTLEDPDERARVEEHGGLVRALEHSSRARRVHIPGVDHPPLALTRSLGCMAAAERGISTAEPDVLGFQLRPGREELLVLGTDGLFEFSSNQEVVSRLLEGGCTRATLEELCAESRNRWAQNSYNQTIDDATVIALPLPLR